MPDLCNCTTKVRLVVCMCISPATSCHEVPVRQDWARHACFCKDTTAPDVFLNVNETYCSCDLQAVYGNMNVSPPHCNLYCTALSNAHT